MRLDENAIPGWIARTGGEHRTRCVVERGHPIDQIAIALAKPGAVRSMLSDNLDIEVLPKIKLPHETFATVTLVSGSRTGNRRPAIGEPTRRGFADHGVEADALHTQLAGIECLTGSKESGIRIGAVGEPRLAVIRTDQRGGVARAIVVRVPHHLDTE